MNYKAMKKLITLSLDTVGGVFPFLKYSLEESSDEEEVTVSFSILKFSGFSSETSKEVIIAFSTESVTFLKVPLESDKRYMNFGYDSLIQLFVLLASFFSLYLDISIKQVLNFFFHENLGWKEFIQFVLETNLIDSTIEGNTVYIYGIGELSFRHREFVWVDQFYNKFSYKVSSDIESLFVLSFVLGYVQAVIGHDLLVADLVDPDDENDPTGDPEETTEDGQDMEPEGLGGPGGGLGGMGGLGGAPMGDLGPEGGLEGMGDSGLEGEGLPEEGGLPDGNEDFDLPPDEDELR